MITRAFLKEYFERTQSLRDTQEMIDYLKKECESGDAVCEYIAEFEKEIEINKSYLEQHKSEIDAFIHECDDVCTRTIMSLRFIRGLLWKEIGLILHASAQCVRGIFYKYFAKIGIE